MTLETLIVKTPDDSFHIDLLENILLKRPSLNWYVISTSSVRRLELRSKYGKQRVLNPFISVGDFKADLIWVEHWPSVMGDFFEEFQFLLFSAPKILILGQKFEVPKWIMRKLKTLAPEYSYLFKQRCPMICLWPKILGFKKLSKQSLNRMFFIYRSKELDFHITLDVRRHSYFLFHSLDREIIAMNCSGLQVQDYKFIIYTLYRFLLNQLRLEWNSLVDYHHDNSNTGNINSKNSLSRSAYNWDFTASKWKKSFNFILWRPRWGEKSKVKHS